MKKLTPLKAVRLKCLDCVCGQLAEVRKCPDTTCPLYPFRLGKNPNQSARVLTEAQREAARVRLANARKKLLEKC